MNFGIETMFDRDRYQKLSQCENLEPNDQPTPDGCRGLHQTEEIPEWNLSSKRIGQSPNDNYQDGCRCRSMQMSARDDLVNICGSSTNVNCPIGVYDVCCDNEVPGHYQDDGGDECSDQFDVTVHADASFARRTFKVVHCVN